VSSKTKGLDDRPGFRRRDHHKSSSRGGTSYHKPPRRKLSAQPKVNENNVGLNLSHDTYGSQCIGRFANDDHVVLALQHIPHMAPRAQLPVHNQHSFYRKPTATH
jgi:hypothetical protein